MPIVINIDMMLAKRKMTLTELSQRIDLSLTNLSILKSGKGRAIRFTTLNSLCKVLKCKPGDILDYLEEDEYKELFRL